MNPPPTPIMADSTPTKKPIVTGKNENASLINYNGGSIEKNIGSKSNFLKLVDSGAPLINFHWMARDHDAIVRPETDLINSIESTTAWFTTWGEYYSYQNSLNNFSVSDEEMEKMQDRSHRYCFIANSLSDEVVMVIN